MKACRTKKNAIGSLLATAVLALSLSIPASAGNTASGTVRLGVVLVSTVQAGPQPTVQIVQFALGNGATLQIDAANQGVKGQVRELDLVIGQEVFQAAHPRSAAAVSAPQSTAKLVQTTFVAE